MLRISRILMIRKGYRNEYRSILQEPLPKPLPKPLSKPLPRYHPLDPYNTQNFTSKKPISQKVGTTFFLLYIFSSCALSIAIGVNYPSLPYLF